METLLKQKVQGSFQWDPDALRDPVKGTRLASQGPGLSQVLPGRSLLLFVDPIVPGLGIT